MTLNKSILKLIILFLPLLFITMGSNKASIKTEQIIDQEIFMFKIDTGLYYYEVQSQIITEIGDYKVEILMIDPQYFEFGFALASQNDSTEKQAPEWCLNYNFNGVINAGMYHANKSLSAVGFLQNGTHLNQSNDHNGHRMVAAFNPRKNGLKDFDIFDLNQTTLADIQESYYMMFQSIRMIDGDGKPVYWSSKTTKRMSLATLGITEDGKVLFFFSRSPFSANEFTDFMLSLPFKVKSAMYLEGGPETSLYVYHDDFCLQRYGSYVSGTFAHDRNDKFWTIPNMLGFRKKQ